MALTIIQHPLAAHMLTHLRDRTTKPALFRTLCHQITLLLALEATRDLATSEKAIETPLEPFRGRVLARPLVIVPILRAGLGMLEPFLDLFPDVSVGYVGLERDHATAIARSYYCKLPPLGGRRVLVIDPMLATGGSAVQALERREILRRRRRHPGMHRGCARRRGPRRKTPPRSSDFYGCARPRTRFEKVHPAGARRFRRPAVRHVSA